MGLHIKLWKYFYDLIVKRGEIMVITTGHPPLKEEAVYTIVMFTQNVVVFSAVTSQQDTLYE